MGMLGEHLKTEKISLVTLLTLFVGGFSYADELETWVDDRVRYALSLHVAAGEHVEAKLSALRLERNHHKSENSAIRREIKDYESRIYNRTNGGSVELTSRDRAQIHFYDTLIEDLRLELTEHDQEIERLDRLIGPLDEQIRNRPIPVAP